jgi:hypothetical protein
VASVGELFDFMMNTARRAVATVEA